MATFTDEAAAAGFAELNRLFGAKELIGDSFYAELSQRGFIHDQCILVSYVPGSANTYTGGVIRQDGRVFYFDVDLDDSTRSSWTDVTETFERDLRAKRFKPWSHEVLAHAELVRRRNNVAKDER